MSFRDLGEFLNLLESKGDLIRIKKEVDWNEEIGALAQETAVRDAPAFICENIKDHKDTAGKKLAMNFMSGWKRLGKIGGNTVSSSKHPYSCRMPSSYSP